VFKRPTGVTPSEFRRRQGLERSQLQKFNRVFLIRDASAACERHSPCATHTGATVFAVQLIIPLAIAVVSIYGSKGSDQGVADQGL